MVWYYCLEQFYNNLLNASHSMFRLRKPHSSPISNGKWGFSFRKYTIDHLLLDLSFCGDTRGIYLENYNSQNVNKGPKMPILCGGYICRCSAKGISQCLDKRASTDYNESTVGDSIHKDWRGNPSIPTSVWTSGNAERSTLWPDQFKQSQVIATQHERFSWNFFISLMPQQICKLWFLFFIKKC